jgi:archaellum biogenesis ATPase FlaH
LNLSSEYSYGEAFQLKLLAACVRRPRKMNGVIDHEFFSNPVHQDLAKLTQGIRDNPDTKTAKLTKTTLLTLMKDYLGDKKKDLWPLYRRVIRKIYKPDLRDLPVLYKEALEFSKNAKFRDALVKAEKDVNDRKYDRVFQRINDLKLVGKDNDLGIDYWKDFKSSKRWLEDRKGIIGTLYFPLLDTAMGGGVGAGELAIVEGGGKSGKSTLLGRIAAGGMWQGKKIAIASGELSAFKYRKRLDSMLTGVSYFDLFTRRNTSTGTRAQLEWIRKQCKGEARIKSFPSGRAKVRDVERWLDLLAEQDDFVADMLVVDYLTLFKPNERQEERRIAIGETAVDLRGLAMEKQIPVWTAAQVNRAGLDKPMIGPSDLAEDVSLFFTLDFLVAICQTRDERGSKEDRRNGKVEKARLLLAAARDTASGAIINVEMRRDKFIVKERGYWTGPEKKDDK